ncbi:hypothetical protein H5410_044309 [Solanum commersonii]|uniref:Uncharacterized protein n=1 Tax=Solanum commersonii TaxID=4109 RepID=A0A9J5X6Q0_SOLCO|nr:hypothetical protein H5410_044309 [Solanum commersonii]
MANQQQNHATMCSKRENNTDVMVSFTDQMDLGVIVLPLHLDGFAAMEVSKNSISSKVRWTMPQSTIDSFELLEQSRKERNAWRFEEKQLHPEDEAELHTAFSFLL